jgi:hypothetical protein
LVFFPQWAKDLQAVTLGHGIALEMRKNFSALDQKSEKRLRNE